MAILERIAELPSVWYLVGFLIFAAVLIALSVWLPDTNTETDTDAETPA